MNTRRLIPYIFVICLSIASCTTESGRNASPGFIKPHLSLIEARAAAQSYIESHRLKLDSFKLTDIHYSYSSGQWIFFYGDKDFAVGKFFTLFINDRSPDKVKFVPGS